MQTIFKFFFMLVCCFYNTAFADAANDELSALLKNTHTMQAEFTQKIIDGKGNTIMASNGKMALQRPGQFRWETLKPNRQLVIAKGTELSIYDPELEQLVIRKLAQQAGETPALLLSDASLALDADFFVKGQMDKSELKWFSLLPKDKTGMFASIKLAFKGNQLAIMQLRDHLDNTTTITFKNVKFNLPLANKLFVFTPPKNTDIINETKKRS